MNANLQVSILIFFQILSINAKSQERILDIDPVYQKTPEWCWVSCGEMVFKYYDICNINPGGDFQCGIIALLGPQCDQNCYSCPVPAGSTQRIINMLAQYPAYAHNICGSDKLSIKCKDTFGSISPESIVDDIDNEMPILAGINPSGIGFGNDPAHATLIVGYEIYDDEMYLIINDPFPYEQYSGMQNPYVSGGGEELDYGQYKIEYSVFRKRFAWNRTLKSMY